VVAAPGLLTLPIPPEANVVAQYPIAALANSANADLAAQFIAYVLSPEGQALLSKWGFTPIAP
jgi:molybdate transport system substrate-binding protein